MVQIVKVMVVLQAALNKSLWSQLIKIVKNKPASKLLLVMLVTAITIILIKDVDGGDGFMHEVVEEDTTDEPDNNKDVDNGDGEDNFEVGVTDGTSDDENIVETSTDNDVDNEDGSDKDTGEEENTNGVESNGGATSADGFGPDSGPHERRKRSVAKRNPRRPHRTHKHFNQKRLENGTLPYKLINVKSLKARLAQRNSNHKSWKQKRAGKFSIYKFLKNVQ